MPDLQSISRGVVLHPLSSDHWYLLRDARLAALRESPQAFLATHEREFAFDEERWRDEFTRGAWYVGHWDGKQVGMVGVTRDPEAPVAECYIEYVWIAPEHRGKGVGTMMMRSLLDRLQESGVKRAHLWVLSDNEDAKRLYERLGFEGPNGRQPLKKDPGRSEERFSRELSGRRRRK